MVNELEQCWSQELTLNKSLTFIEGCYKGVAAGLAAHDHEPTELLYTDNTQAELAFHEKTTASLRRNVSHVVIDPYGHMPIFSLPADVELQYYDALDLIDPACLRLLSNAGLNDSKLVVGFDIRYQAEPDGQGGLVSKSDEVDVIQIATGDTVYVFKVSHIIVKSKVTQFSSALPPNLQALIMTPNVIKDICLK
jgi:hypothetical protein